VKLTELLDHYCRALHTERDRASANGLDEPVTVTNGRRLATIGTLHQYAFDLAQSATLWEDVPLTILPPGNMEPTEGFALDVHQHTACLQTFDAFGQTVAAATLVPDTTGFLDTVAHRLLDMAKESASYALGPAERLVPWLDPNLSTRGQPVRPATSASVLATNWSEDLQTRRGKLAAMAIELVRQNKRLLLVSPNHRAADELAGLIARTLRGAGLTFKSLVSRYEMPLLGEAAGMPLQDLGFEAQMHQFFAQSRADKAALRRKYERFRELTPLLAYKAEKQRDLDEVKLLEWRLLTQLSDLQGKIKEVDATLAEYEAIPIWKRLAMQAVGKNVESLAEYRTLYEQQVKMLMDELETAQKRIAELSPEAAIPKDLRPEYEELKAEIKRLGGTKQIRELLAAEEGTNRQAFIQNKRVVLTTATRVASDPLFSRVRFDVLLADEAPLIPAPLLLASAGLVRERIVLSGDERDIATSRAWREPALFPSTSR
jgi:hypothetical protein